MAVAERPAGPFTSLIGVTMGHSGHEERLRAVHGHRRDEDGKSESAKMGFKGGFGLTARACP